MCRRSTGSPLASSLLMLVLPLFMCCLGRVSPVILALCLLLTFHGYLALNLTVCSFWVCSRFVFLTLSPPMFVRPSFVPLLHVFFHSSPHHLPLSCIMSASDFTSSSLSASHQRFLHLTWLWTWTHALCIFPHLSSSLSRYSGLQRPLMDLGSSENRSPVSHLHPDFHMSAAMFLNFIILLPPHAEHTSDWFLGIYDGFTIVHWNI